MSNFAERMASVEVKIENIEKKVDSGFQAVNKKLDEFITTADQRYAAKRDVEELKDNQKWVVRLILGTVIVALLGLVVYIAK